MPPRRFCLTSTKNPQKDNVHLWPFRSSAIRERFFLTSTPAPQNVASLLLKMYTSGFSVQLPRRRCLLTSNFASTKRRNSLLVKRHHVDFALLQLYKRVLFFTFKCTLLVQVCTFNCTFLVFVVKCHHVDFP